MYLQSFGLTKKPFGLTSDEMMVYLSPCHGEALAGLCYSLLHKKGLIVLLAPAGTGKTTLLARVGSMLMPSRVRFATILNPTLTTAEFIEAMLMGFAIREDSSSKPRRLLALHDMLLETQAEGKVAALIVDEAHKLSPEVLEEVRLLGNLEHKGEKLLQIVLAGQNDLGTLLNGDVLVQLKQRIAMRLSLRPLSRSEVKEYIRYRWVHAGGPHDLPFVTMALELITQYSRGIPRLVNSICDNALLLAFSEQSSLVQAIHVFESCVGLDLVKGHCLRDQRVEMSPELVPPLPIAQPARRRYLIEAGLEKLKWARSSTR